MPLKRWTDFKAGDRVIASDCQRDAGTVLEVGPDATVAGRVHVQWDDGAPASWLRADLLKPAAPDFSALPDIDAARRPIVQRTDTNEAMADSRDVAIYFGKVHRDVVRSIEVLAAKDADWGMRNFTRTPYVEPQNGQTYHFYRMTKSGFSMLAMGFTGDRAFQFKLRYIEAFEDMEAELRKRSAPAHTLPQSFAEALRLAADQADLIAKQGAESATLAPKATFHDAVAVAVNSQTMEAAAKVLGIGRNTLFKFLRDQKILQQNNRPYQTYLDLGHFSVVERVWRDRDDQAHTDTTTLVTGKGLIFLRKKLAERQIATSQTVPALPAAATAH